MRKILDKIEIQNFQSHKKSIFEFVPGTNVIIGESDSGKSSILRAINWVIFNRPLGDAFRSEWGGDTRVILYTKDGHKIERVRSATKNEYILNGQKLKAFGTEVPQEITNILQLDSYNIQAQMDPPFLLSQSPGEAARMLNKAASIDDIDKAISGLKSGLSKINTEIKYKESQVKKTKELLQTYDYLPEIELKVERVEQLENERDKLSKRISSLQQIQKEVERVQIALSKIRDPIILLKRISEIKDLYELSQTKVNQYNNMNKIIHHIKRVEHLLAQTEGIDQILERIDITHDILAQFKEKKKQAGTLNKMLNDIEKNTNTLNRIKKNIKQLEEKYQEIAPETCPLCGGKLKERGI